MSQSNDTQANHQAMTTLYSGSQRKVIDTTTTDDKEVLILSSHDLSGIACDIEGAITVLHDVGQLLGLIHHNKLEVHAVEAMARLAHDATDTWADLLHNQLNSINKPLAMTGYGKEGSQ